MDELKSRAAEHSRRRCSCHPSAATEASAEAALSRNERSAKAALLSADAFASSKSERHLAAYGLETGFQATKRIRIGEWFNAEPTDPRSCCQLTDVVTEFQCQGLELDLAVVCWSDDFWWGGEGWLSKPQRRRSLVRDPHQLRTNAYRVLLTRGREGLVLFVPPAPAREMDATFEALRSAGAEQANSRTRGGTR